ncbi:MAG: hypothetical protein C0498_14140 [Anaerolinea sp.]|nr:hypothetical protein [Anaerolinea sp.]
MARAKRTDRSDARRRWRQAHAGELEESEAVAPASEPAPRQASAPSERPSITGAFRNAYRPARIREDIAALPWLLLTRGFLVSLALVVGGTVAVVVAPGNTVTNLLFQAMVVPPAMAPIFIVGFFARRASYLLGLIIALIDVAAYAVFVYAVGPGLTTEPIDPVQQQQLVFSAISVGPLSGVFFAAAAAWYRRFLTLSNANAQQRARARQQQKSRAGRPARG